jgi:hypothetical protein
MKIYAETKKSKKFDWKVELEKRLAKNLKPIPTLSKKSKSWVTCACGNQCAAIPRKDDGSPWDEELQELGTSFFYKVGDGNWQEALNILEKIENRSAILIRKIKQEAIETLLLIEG